MKATDLQTFAEALGYIREEARLRKTPERTPTSLPLEDIYPASLLFQPREGLDERHVRTLRSAIKSNGDHLLTPVVVWWSGKYWRLLDGYHRREAYRLCIEKDHIPIDRIPVKAFNGSLEQAIAHAVACNSKDKKPMTRSEKSERAWKLIAMKSELKQKTIAVATGVHRRTLSFMKRKLRELPAEMDPLTMTWSEVLGHSPSNFDRDEAVSKILKDLQKTFGKQPIKSPDVFAEALKAYSESLAEFLGEEYFPAEPEIIGRCMANQTEDYFIEVVDPHEFGKEVMRAFNEQLNKFEERDNDPF